VVLRGDQRIPEVADALIALGGEASIHVVPVEFVVECALAVGSGGG
jgi:hypothetical protein